MEVFCLGLYYKCLFCKKHGNRMRWPCLAWVGVPRSSEVSEVVDEVQAVVVLHLASGAQVGEQLQSFSTDLILSFCRHCPPASFWLGSSTPTDPFPPTPHKHLTQVTLGYWLREHPLERKYYFHQKYPSLVRFLDADILPNMLEKNPASTDLNGVKDV